MTVVYLQELKAAFMTRAKTNIGRDAQISPRNHENRASIQSVPRSGWDVFREEQRLVVISEGFTGKDVSSQLGERWRGLPISDKKKYKLKAKNRSNVTSFLNTVPSSIERSVSLLPEKNHNSSSNTKVVNRNNSL